MGPVPTFDRKAEATPKQRAARVRRTRWILLTVALMLVGTLFGLLPVGYRVTRRFWATTALYEAVRTRDQALALKSLRRGADPNARTAGGLRGGTPLAWAVDGKDQAMIRLLLKHGADPLAPDSVGATAIDYARASGDQALIDLLSPKQGSLPE